MSSPATAPTRMLDQDPRRVNLPPDLLGNPDEPASAESPHLEHAAGGNAAVPTLDEVNRVERLLSQLEARSMALVPYGYGALREVPTTRRSSSVVVAGTLVAIWVTTLIFGVAYIRYVSRGPALPERAAAPLVIPSEPDPQEQKVAASVDHLAKALASSSERMNELQAAMDRSEHDLQKLAASKTAVDRPSTTVNSKAEPASNTSAATAAVVASEAPLPKNWHRVLEVKPTEAAQPHKSPDGSIDYWLVPRAGDSTPSKVLPIGTSAEGVVVHNLEDGKDYTLTPSGEWRNGALTSSGSN